ncbi:hypothetical protein F4823DRAFT_581359 [Ustulina deusta]|nr:hypothetical protein F4823DRAFT_581359 [Ustulina deusta]
MWNGIIIYYLPMWQARRNSTLRSSTQTATWPSSTSLLLTTTVPTYIYFVAQTGYQCGMYLSTPILSTVLSLVYVGSSRLRHR